LSHIKEFSSTKRERHCFSVLFEVEVHLGIEEKKEQLIQTKPTKKEEVCVCVSVSGWVGEGFTLEATRAANSLDVKAGFSNNTSLKTKRKKQR
jgi:hypothetical protein